MKKVFSAEAAEPQDMRQQELKGSAVAEMASWILQLRSKGPCDSTVHVRS